MIGRFSTFTPPKTIDGHCFGFAWIGQSFKWCDACGEPYWEHKYESRVRDGRYLRKLITRDVAEGVRARRDR